MAIAFDAVTRRVGGARWVVVWDQGMGPNVETTTPAPHDELYRRSFGLDLPCNLPSGVNPTTTFGDLGRRLRAVGVERLLVIPLTNAGVAVIEDPEEGATTPIDMSPPGEDSTWWPALLHLRRRTREWEVSASVIAALDAGGDIAEVARLVRTRLGCDAAVVLWPLRGDVWCSLSDASSPDPPPDAGPVSDLKWSDVVADPRAALRRLDRQASPALGSTPSIGLVSAGALVAVPGGAASEEGLTTVAAAVAAFSSWIRVTDAYERNAHAAERGRLAVQIHEGAMQALTNLAITLDVLQRQSDGEVRSYARASRSAVLEVLDSLRSVLLDEGGGRAEAIKLSDLMAALVEDYNSEWGLHVTFRCEGDERPVSAQMAGALSSLAQEGLTNLRRHSGVTTGLVTLRFSPDATEVTISDEGRGLDARLVREPGQEGHGVSLLAAHLASLGGAVDVETSPGRGFTLIGRVPRHLADAPDPFGQRLT